MYSCRPLHVHGVHECHDARRGVQDHTHPIAKGLPQSPTACVCDNDLIDKPVEVSHRQRLRDALELSHLTGRSPPRLPRLPVSRHGALGGRLVRAVLLAVAIPRPRSRMPLLLAFVGGFTAVRIPLYNLIALEHRLHGSFPTFGKTPKPTFASVRAFNDPGLF